MLLVHGSATSSAYFSSILPRLAGRWTVTTVDRPGWGESPAPEDYRNTSIAEQAIAVAGAASRALESGSLTVAGVDFGAVVAFELGLANPEAVERVVMVDPPIYGTLPSATEGISLDVEQIRDAVESDGEQAAYELFTSGALGTLGAGAGRLGSLAFTGPSAARSLLVELPAVPAWSLDPARLVPLSGRVTVGSTPTAPPVLAQAAAGFASRIGDTELIGLESDGPAAVAEAL